MRQELYDYISGLNLGSFILTSEVPWTESATPLYLKNPKKIYIDITQYSVDPFIVTLSNLSISNETATVRVYFSADAKNLPANYDTVVSELRSAKDADSISGIFRRQCDVSTDIVNDLIVTTLEFRFIKLI